MIIHLYEKDLLDLQHFGQSQKFPYSWVFNVENFDKLSSSWPYTNIFLINIKENIDNHEVCCYQKLIPTYVKKTFTATWTLKYKNLSDKPSWNWTDNVFNWSTFTDTALHTKYVCLIDYFL